MKKGKRVLLGYLALQRHSSSLISGVIGLAVQTKPDSWEEGKNKVCPRKQQKPTSQRADVQLTLAVVYTPSIPLHNPNSSPLYNPHVKKFRL